MSLASSPYVPVAARRAVEDGHVETIVRSVVALIDFGLTIEQAEARMKAAFREAVSRRIEKAVLQAWCV